MGSAAPVKAHLGVIDVGSNAIRLQVARLHEDGRFTVIHDERVQVRLGDEVFRSGRLDDRAVEFALSTLTRFAQTAREYGTERIRAVATSAVRDATNGKTFLGTVKEQAGLELEVITGLEEATLIARGVLPNMQSQRAPVGLVDIGGGSTELTVVENGRIAFIKSLELGSIRLTNMFCRTDPLHPDDEAQVRSHIRAQLSPIDRSRLPPCRTLIGSAGTVGALANFIHRRPSTPRTGANSSTSFTLRDLTRAVETLTKMPNDERKVSPGIEDRRSELIVAGALILEEICLFTGAKGIKFVRRGLRDGLMLQLAEATSQQAARRIPGRVPRRRSGGGVSSPA